MTSVYLAGPIAGCTEMEAKDWRQAAEKYLAYYDIRGISPLRCEPAIDDRYDMKQSNDPKFGTQRAIAAKNMFDVRQCTLVLAYLPKFMNARRPSYGTICEIAWAHALSKSVVLVTDDAYLAEHPTVQLCASWILPTLRDGLDTIRGVLTDYVKDIDA